MIISNNKNSRGERPGLKSLFYAFYIIFFALVSVELFGQIQYKIKYHEWLYKKDFGYQEKLFQPHPWLVGSPRPNTHVEYKGLRFSHNAQGYRGETFTTKKKLGIKRIVCYGGSTTYGAGVSDENTWPYYLGKNLGNRFEVINAGVPGYSTVEAIIQTALQQMDLSPDIAIYYLGWNDLRNMHIQELESDYSGYHGNNQRDNLGLNLLKIGNHSYVIWLLKKVLERTFSKRNEYELRGQMSSEVDLRALGIYEYNLQTIIAISKSRNIKLFFIPQILNGGSLKADSSYGWAPFIKDKGMTKVMNVYNEQMIRICHVNNISCSRMLIENKWADSDFLDQGHFSSKGNKKFAELLASELAPLLN